MKKSEQKSTSVVKKLADHFHLSEVEVLALAIDATYPPDLREAIALDKIYLRYKTTGKLPQFVTNWCKDVVEKNKLPF